MKVKGHQPRRSDRAFFRYTIYKNATDEIVILDGSARECAEAMGLTLSSFYSEVSRRDQNKKWNIEIKYFDERKQCDGFYDRINDPQGIGPTFGQRLLLLRREQGFSQAQIAEELGVAQSTVCAWEKNRMEPKLFLAVCIADFFNVSLDWLTGREH